MFDFFSRSTQVMGLVTYQSSPMSTSGLGETPLSGESGLPWILLAQLAFVDWRQTIGCSGVAVISDDIIVADDNGAIVILTALLNEVVEVALAQEQSEPWILKQIKSGASLNGLYPMSAENQARYEADVREGRI